MVTSGGKMKKTGILYGLGIGPGDPELITIKARKILKRVNIVFAPRGSRQHDSLAENIIKDYINPSKIKTIIFPMTKDKSTLKKRWRENAGRVYAELSKGKNVAFVTIGDPYLYSTYINLVRHLKMIDAAVSISTVPGISVVNAIASVSGMPLAQEDERCVIMPLPRQIGKLKKVLSEFDTVVLLKIGRRLKALVRFLESEGYADKACFAGRVGTPVQRVEKDISHLEVDDKKLGYMSTMIIRPKQKDRV